ncbi:MAG: NitT/TauT family transport system substrate-binding protein [Alphaproteobacteria bacterium]|jgi:NitT/TauT family transport system substrate-binding protein|nr:NitT/TauT family transport system substrate-binding protein [Alphaproteobacteria bacterium]
MAARRPMWHSPGMMTLREEPVRILSAVLLTIVLASAAGAQQRAPVKITVVPSIPAASTFLALDKGYFRDAGLDVTIERVDSLSRAVPFLATNQVQVGQGGISAGFFNAVAEGLPLTITLDAGSTPLYHRIILRSGLKDTIRTVADLKGRKVGISSPGSAAVYEIGMVLASAGLKLKDIDVKYISYTQMGPALANGALDAALQVAPFIDIAIEQKMAVGWIDPEDHIKQLPLTNVFTIANVDWIKREPDVARRVFVALARAGRDYCQAYHRGPNRGELIDVMIRNKVVTDRDLLDQMEWQARSPNGTVEVASVASMQAFYKDEAIIEKTAPPARLVDASFAAAAATELGPFELINKASTLKGCR